MIKSKYKISSVESFTGGLFASEIISNSNASSCFKGSLVAYDSIVKQNILNIDISKGVINKDVSQKMALNGNKYFDSDLCISFTGNAGPLATEGLPVGFIYISICFGDNLFTYKYNLKGNRNDIRKKAVEIAIDILKNKGYIEIVDN